MSLLSELLKESASAGATSAGGVANDRGTLFGGGNGGSTIMLRRMGFVEVGDLPNKKKKKQLFKSLREADSSAVAVKPFDYQDTLSKLDQAVKTASERKEDVAVFGLEDDEGKIVKVYVDKDQASKFEDALAIMLADNDTIFSDEDEPKNEQEIAEILYKLKDQFNIRDVEWGTIHGDEEEEEQVDVDSEEGADDMESDLTDVDSEEGVDELGVDELGDEESEAPDESDAQTALQAVIAMMQSDSEARKAEADARKSEADAVIARNASAAAQAQVAKEEDLLDMKTHEKAQKDAKKEAETLAKLAKYKKEVEGGIDDVEIDGDDGAEDFSDIDAIDELPPEENEEVSSDKEEDQPEITKEQLAKLILKYASGAQ